MASVLAGPKQAKGRTVTVLRLLALVLIALMATVIAYMYRTIDRLHRDQQEMRVQLVSLQNGEMRHEFLESREPREPRVPQHGSDFAAQRLGGLVSSGGPPRKLSSFTVGTTLGVGCFQISDAAAAGYDVSGSNCNSNACPDCFITPSTVSQAIVLTVSSCSSAMWARSQTRAGAWAYTFINTSPTYTMSVTDNSGSGITYKVAVNSHVLAFCASSQGTSNRLHWPSTTLPTLSVDSGLTLSAGNFDASSSSGTFKTSTGVNTLGGNTIQSGSKSFATGTGTVSLNGATTVADSTTFTVGSSTAGGASQFFGSVTIGGSASGASVSTTLYGSFAQNDDASGATKTFSTASGANSFNGHIAVASGKNLIMSSSGAGALTTGTGVVTINGNTLISGSNTFATGSGTVSLNGATTVAASTTFTVGSSAAGGASQFYGPVTIGGSASGASVSTTLYGSFSQNDDASGSTKTFSTATGAVSLNGDIAVASGKNLAMVSTGAGAFTSGTGVVTLNGNTIISSSKTFATGTGSVSLNGATTVADGIPFSVGSLGAGGISQFFGSVQIGGSSGTGYSRNLNVYGSVSLNNDADGTLSTFSTATGGVSLNGDVAVATNKHLLMSNTGTGTFQTGTGPISLNGDTTIFGTHTFMITAYSNALACNHAAGDVGNTFCKASR